MNAADGSGLDADGIVDFIADIFRRRGADSYLGEDVTMSQHMLQGAALAEAAGEPDEVVAAALLHDIGHYTNEFPPEIVLEVDNRHDQAGGEVLKPFFPSLVVDCVRCHVDAKRYLCAAEPDYFDGLSPASVRTLELQGGPMTPDEVAAFASEPHLDAILKVRRWDDGGKDAAAVVPGFDHYEPMLRRVVARHAAGRGA